MYIYDIIIIIIYYIYILYVYTICIYAYINAREMQLLCDHAKRHKHRGKAGGYHASPGENGSHEIL